MKTRWAVSVLLILAASTLLAQAAPADTPASKDDVLKLFDVMQVRQQMRMVMDSVSKQQAALMRDTVRKRNPQITEKEFARLESLMQEFMKDFPVEGLLDDMIPVYQKHLTKADVDTMSSFYSSPTGQKLLKEMPAMTSESMQAAYGRMQKQMDVMMERVDKMIREEHQQKTAPSPQTKPKPESLQN